MTVPLQTPFTVNATGVLQSIAALDPEATILAYSWLDDSATDAGITNLAEVNQSEAYTHVNGRRLANALNLAIAPSFWERPGTLRIVGHSHGSKVATVAALTLQQQGRKVAHLTICDAPESEATLEANGANLLGFYLEQMQIADPSHDCAAGTFVDNYASYFGVGYAGLARADGDRRGGARPEPALRNHRCPQPPRLRRHLVRRGGGRRRQHRRARARAGLAPAAVDVRARAATKTGPRARPLAASGSSRRERRSVTRSRTRRSR